MPNIEKEFHRQLRMKASANAGAEPAPSGGFRTPKTIAANKAKKTKKAKRR